MSRSAISMGCLAIILMLLVAIGCNGTGNGATPDNGGQTQTEPTAPTEPTQLASWHNITTFTSTAGKTTDTFQVTGKKFRLTWTVNPDPEYIDFDLGGDLYIFIYPEGETALYVGSVMTTNNMTTTSDTTVVHEGPGYYYLVVTVACVESWQVQIEDYN